MFSLRGWGKGRGGWVRNIGHGHDFCQAHKAENTPPRTNYAVKYATARGHLNSVYIFDFFGHFRGLDCRPTSVRYFRNSCDRHPPTGSFKNLNFFRNFLKILNVYSGVAPANQTKKGQFMNFSRGHSGTKVQCELCLFSQGKTPEFTKMGEIHELFVLVLSLVWFAGATPDLLLGKERLLLGIIGVFGFWGISFVVAGGFGDSVARRAP